jgi:hypothetical protein
LKLGSSVGVSVGSDGAAEGEAVGVDGAAVEGAALGRSVPSKSITSCDHALPYTYNEITLVCTWTDA